MEEKQGAKSKATTAVVIVLLLFFSSLLFSLSSVSKAQEPINCLDDDEEFFVETSELLYYSDYLTSAGSKVPIGRDFGPTFNFYMTSWNDDWQDKGIWYLVRGTGTAMEGDLVTWWPVQVDRYISDDPEWEWYVEVPLPDMIMPLFAEVGIWHLEFHMTNKAIWLIEYDYHILSYYFDAVEATLWDNLFAPYYLTWGGANLWIIELSSGFTISIPAPLFIIVALVIIVLIIKFVIPLWVAIPSVADPKNKKRGRMILGGAYRG